MQGSSRSAGEGRAVETARAGGDRATVSLQYRQERTAPVAAFPKGRARGAGRRTPVRRAHGERRHRFRLARLFPRVARAPIVEKTVAAVVATGEGVSVEGSPETKQDELKRARRTTDFGCRRARATPWWP